ncbi:MAG: translocation protein TolB [Acidobacteria bacterium]|nr:MAG: translocation protein TolB [Acidobacteriota bacterium]
MKKKSWFTLTFAVLFGIITLIWAQEGSVVIKIVGSQRPAIAVPDLRGSGAAQNFMGAFNDTLFSDLQNSGLFEMRPKGMYPLQVPQRPEEFRQPPRPGASLGGMALSDWSSPPVQANFLTTGYTAEQNGQIALYGWLFDVGQPNIVNAQVVGKRYFGTLDEAGARKVAHEFAADILAHWGATSLFGTKIYFVSDRTGHKEIWSMDPDGSNQKQITSFKSISIMPAVSPDGAKIAFTSFARGNPAIFILSTETARRLSFYNQVASLNATPDFTPDGKQILYASSASGYAQIYVANLDGSSLKRISSSRAIEVEPKVNPKTGNDIVFVSGRTGPQQIFRMNFDGTGVERLTNGEGEASNPSWNPDGQHIAFSWTRGYATGNFNLFLMDVATRQFDQLTHSEGRNENPSWAPDGRHLVFMSTRSGSHQIYSMLADGTQVHQLTTSGRNQTPVWGK